MSPAILGEFTFISYVTSLSFLILILSLFVMRRLVSGRNSLTYWTSRNVPFIDCPELDLRVTTFHEKEGEMYQKVLKEAGNQGYVGILEGGKPILYVMDPNLIKNILVKDFHCFVDRRVLLPEPGSHFLSNMLINAKGQFWRALRAALTPSFTTGRIRGMFPIFSNSSLKLKEFLRKQIQRTGEKEVNLRDVLSRYSRDVIFRTAFGLESQSFSEEETPLTQKLSEIQNPKLLLRGWKRTVATLYPQLAKLLGIGIPAEEAIGFFRQLLSKTIRERDASGERWADVLQLLMDLRQDKAEGGGKGIGDDRTPLQWNQQLILAQALNYFLGGSETVESALCTTANELALNPGIQEKVYQELIEATKGTDRLLDYDSIMRLDYLEMVVSEALRKWPTSVRLERRSTSKYQIPGSNLVLDEGSMIVIPVFGMQRNEEYFPSPNKFDPDRFSPANKTKMDPYTYLPFGAGPRACIATRFVYAEVKTAIAHLILNFRLDATKKTEISLKFKAPTGIWVRVVERQNQ